MNVLQIVMLLKTGMRLIVIFILVIATYLLLKIYQVELI